MVYASIMRLTPIAECETNVDHGFLCVIIGQGWRDEKALRRVLSVRAFVGFKNISPGGSFNMMRGVIKIVR